MENDIQNLLKAFQKCKLSSTFLDLTVGLGICMLSTFGWWVFFFFESSRKTSFLCVHLKVGEIYLDMTVFFFNMKASVVCLLADRKYEG